MTIVDNRRLDYSRDRRLIVKEMTVQGGYVAISLPLDPLSRIYDNERWNLWYVCVNRNLYRRRFLILGGVDGRRDMRAGQLSNAGEKTKKIWINSIKTFKARTSQIVKQCRLSMLYLPGKKPRTIMNHSIARVLIMLFGDVVSSIEYLMNFYLYWCKILCK